MRRLGLIASAFAMVLFAACGDCGEEPPSENDVSGGDGNVGDGVTDGYQTLPDGRVVDGGDGTGGDSGGGTGGSDQCSGTQELCNGECVSTNLDPNNCGSCGNTCQDGTVCNAGQCVDSCPYGMEECDGRCVDTGTNDDHCGSCGNECADDKACGNGNCVDTVDVGPGPNNCPGGGPAVEVDFGESTTKEVCSGSVATTTFKWAMCSCDEFATGNNVFMDAFDSQKGPYDPENPGYGGGLGSNGRIHIGKGEIYGSIWTSGEQGISSAPELFIRQQMHSQGDVTFGAQGAVDGETWVKGDIGGGTTGGSKIPIGDTLHIPQSSTIGSRIQANNVKRESVNVSQVCNRCKDNPIPVERIVKNHQNNNDNGVIGLKTDALQNPGKQIVLKLPCGKYYLDGVDISSKVTILAEGNTALFIDGDVRSDGDFTIKPTPSGEFDVFVNGEVELQNDIQVGAPAYPALMRFYVNGQWTFKNNGDFGAYIYAVPGGISAAMNNIVLFGGMYTQNYQSMNNIDVHYDRALFEVDEDCPDPDDGGGDAGVDGGMDADGGGGTMCTAEGQNCSSDSECCNDLLCEGGTCGTSCTDQGGSCSSDGDCCSPLVCRDGTCETSSCIPLGETCSADGDCCSGTCGGGSCISG